MNPVAVWVLLLLIVAPNGEETRQSIPFATKDDCTAAIMEYDNALIAADWDTDLHGLPEAMCKRMVGT